MEVSRATCTRGDRAGARLVISSQCSANMSSAVALSSTSSSSGQTIASTTEINKESGTSIECSLQDYVESFICHDVF